MEGAARLLYNYIARKVTRASSGIAIFCSETPETIVSGDSAVDKESSTIYKITSPRKLIVSKSKPAMGRWYAPKLKQSRRGFKLNRPAT